MAAPYTITTTSPADDDVASQYPANERAFRTTVKDWLEQDHSATTGNHKYVTLDDPGSEPTYASAKLGIYQRAGVLKTKLASGTAKQIAQFTTGSSGDKVVFAQAVAPTGWTQDTTNNDRVLRVTNSTGAGTGGSWTITGLAADAHTHSGTVAGSTGSASGGGSSQSGGGSITVGTAHTHNLSIGFTTGAASATGVTHTPSWRPSYVDVIVCYMTT